jgi:hypothetical protein
MWVLTSTAPPASALLDTVGKSSSPKRPACSRRSTYLKASNSATWARIDNVYDAELWETHRTLKASLIGFARREVGAQRQRDGYPGELVEAAARVLDPDALTIGFARRFATYKRSNLIFSDRSRLERMILHPGRPVQLVFSGKAHPDDPGGKAIVARLARAQAAVDRFTNNAYDLVMGGESYRQRQKPKISGKETTEVPPTAPGPRSRPRRKRGRR